jgi:2,3-bisphosphoglycerate-independent phosphoglycerate mutase
MANVKKPLILLLLEGWGLNSSWNKNAIASASPVNFDILWQKYNHKVIRPVFKESILDKKQFYKAFYNDGLVKTSAQEITDALTNSKISENQRLGNLIASISQHSSKLHYILTLSQDNLYSDCNHLLTLVKFARRSGIFQQQIHVFIGNFHDQTELANRLNKLAADLASIGNAEISTINPLANLWSREKLNRTLKTIISGIGRKILSPTQLSSLSEGSILSDSFIMSKNRNFNISDFDGILFTDHYPEAISPLLQYFSDKGSFIAGINKPKYLNVSSLVNNVSVEAGSIVNLSGTSEWLSQFKLASKECLVIADNETLKLISSITEIPSVFTLYPIEKIARSDKLAVDKLKNLLQFVLDRVEKQQEDMILIDLPFIANICQKGIFGDVVEVVKYVDDFLRELVSCIIRVDGTMIISSLYGMAEDQTMISLPYGDWPKYSNNPLPFIHISNNTKNSTPSKLGLMDLISIKNDLSFLKKAIIEDLGINN